MNLLGRFLRPRYPGFVLALAGGGGRGLAHLGAIKALEENGLRPDAIVGTSIGALFGAMYALNPDATGLQRRVFEFLDSDAFQNLSLPSVHDVDTEGESWLTRLSTVARQTILYTRALTDIAVADDAALAQVAGVFCGEGNFETMKIPLHVTAVRFPGGECHVFSQGDLCKALAASMAVPGVFDPVEIDGHRYLDGGLASEVPAMEARNVAGEKKLVVAVNTGARPDPEHAPSNVMGMLDWAAQVKSLYLRQYEKAHADVLIEPLVGYTQWHDFSNSDHEVQRGYEATIAKVPELKRLLGV
ncbi:MAG: patatin-like phospholipase family protein [Mariprofundaceae bacterium]